MRLCSFSGRPNLVSKISIDKLKKYFQGFVRLEFAVGLPSASLLRKSKLIFDY